MTSAKALAVAKPAPRPEDAASRAAPRSHLRLAMVANRTGGQGKTLVSQVLLDYLARRGFATMPLVADSKAPASGGPGDEGRAKLAACLGGAIEFGIGRDIGATGAQAELLAYWDRLGLVVTETDSLLDVGANVVDQILAWARASDARDELEDVLRVDVVVPFTLNHQAMRDAEAMIDAMLKPAALPIRNLYLGRNAFGTHEASDDDVKALVSRVRGLAAAGGVLGGVALLRLDACGGDAGTRILSELDRALQYVGSAHGLPGRGAPAPAVPSPLEGLPQAMPGVRAAYDVPALVDAARAKIDGDRRAILAHVADLTLFEQGRIRSKLSKWFESFHAQLDACGFAAGFPLAATDLDFQQASISEEDRRDLLRDTAGEHDEAPAPSDTIVA